MINYDSECKQEGQDTLSKNDIGYSLSGCVVNIKWHLKIFFEKPTDNYLLYLNVGEKIAGKANFIFL